MQNIQKNALLLIAALLLAGCGEPRCWYKPGVSLEQAMQECRACYEQAQVESNLAVLDASRQAQVSGAPFVPEVENHFHQNWAEDAPERCLKARGYRQFPQDQLPRPLRTRWVESLFHDNFLVAGQ